MRALHNCKARSLTGQNSWVQNPLHGHASQFGSRHSYIRINKTGIIVWWVNEQNKRVTSPTIVITLKPPERSATSSDCLAPAGLFQEQSSDVNTETSCYLIIQLSGLITSKHTLFISMLILRSREPSTLNQRISICTQTARGTTGLRTMHVFSIKSSTPSMIQLKFC